MLSGWIRLPSIVTSAGACAVPTLAQDARANAASAAPPRQNPRLPFIDLTPCLLDWPTVRLAFCGHDKRWSRSGNPGRSVQAPLARRTGVAALERAGEVRRILETVGEGDLRGGHPGPARIAQVRSGALQPAVPQVTGDRAAGRLAHELIQVPAADVLVLRDVFGAEARDREV